MSLIAPHQRVYLRSHPLAFFFSLGLALTVTIGIIDPSTKQETAASLLLPDWLENLFAYSYAAGGWLATIGLLRARPNIEAAGQSMLSAGLATQFLTLLYLSPHLAWPGAPFFVGLAIGTALRAYYLASGPSYGGIRRPIDE